jgi:GH24 family phage-related lysozyme (muramidase)
MAIFYDVMSTWNNTPYGRRACTQQDIDNYNRQFPTHMTPQQARAEQHRIEDRYANTVNGYLTVQLSQYQFDAIVDFAYNAGPGVPGGDPRHNGFYGSQLRTDINNGNCAAATISADWRHYHQPQDRQNDKINLFNLARST